MTYDPEPRDPYDEIACTPCYRCPECHELVREDDDHECLNLEDESQWKQSSQ